MPTGEVRIANARPEPALYLISGNVMVFFSVETVVYTVERTPFLQNLSTTVIGNLLVHLEVQTADSRLNLQHTQGSLPKLLYSSIAALWIFCSRRQAAAPGVQRPLPKAPCKRPLDSATCAAIPQNNVVGCCVVQRVQA